MPLRFTTVAMSAFGAMSTVRRAPAAFPWQIDVYARLAVAPLPGENFFAYGPGGLQWVTNFDISQFDVASSAPDAVNYYVSLSAGSNSNDGLTPSTPKRSIYQVTAAALAASHANVIYNVEPNYYGDTDSFIASSGGAITFNATIRPWTDGPHANPQGDGTGRIKSSTETVNTSFALDATTGLYVGSYAGTVAVLDSSVTDEYGLWGTYERVKTIEECQVLPGSWYQESATGNSVYVHPLSGAFVTGQHRIIRSKQNFRVDAFNGTVYAENVDFIGSSSGGGVRFLGNPSNLNRLALKNCAIYWPGENGVGTLGGSEIYMQGMRIGRTYADGFNYHAGSGAITRALEVGCYAFELGNKYAATHNCNPSTGHDGCIVIRLGTEGYRSEGPMLTDVTGVKSWNVAPVMRESVNLNPPDHTGNAGIYASGADTEMWVDSPTTEGVYWDYVTTGGARLNIRNGAKFSRIYGIAGVRPY